MDEWIHVDDDLPTDDRKVLICYTDRYQEVGDESTFMTELLFGEVIAWRELPEPFKPILHL
jgi:hypothetical protein